MTLPVEGDTPIHRLTVAELRDEQLDKLLESKREARMMAQVIYERALALKQAAKEAKLEAQLEKKVKQLEKSIEAVDKNIDKMWKYMNEVRALKLQLGGGIDEDVPIERPGVGGVAEEQRSSSEGGVQEASGVSARPEATT